MIGATVCDAFPDGVPNDIIENVVDHRDPIDGDDGLTFSPVSQSATRYAETVFDEDDGGVSRIALD